MNQKLGVIRLIVLGILVFGTLAAAQQQTTVTFWHTYSPAEAKFLIERVIPAFEALHPDIKVQELTVPYEVNLRMWLGWTSSGCQS